MTNTTKAPRRKLLDRLSIRTKLVVANLFVVVFAITILGTYIILRGQEITKYLSEQLKTNTETQTEDILASRVNEESSVIDAYFNNVTTALLNVKGTAEGLITTQNESIVENPYWNGLTKLSKAENSNWDNPNSDFASVYVPGNVELSAELITELNSLSHLDFTAPLILKNNPNIIALYFIGTSAETVYYPNVDLASILEKNYDSKTGPWYVAASPENNPQKKTVWTVPYQDPALTGLLVTNSAPIFDSSGTFKGIVAADVKLSSLTTLVSQIRVGRTGYAFIVDGTGHIIAMPESGYGDFNITKEDVPMGEPLKQTLLDKVTIDVYEALIKMVTGQNGIRTITLKNKQYYLAFNPIKSVNYELGLIVPVEEMQESYLESNSKIFLESQLTQSRILLLTVGVLIAAIILALLTSNLITAPLLNLIESSRQFSDGNINVEIEVRSADEIGILANAMNTMTSTIRGLIGNLERRVEERSEALQLASEKSEKRARQLKSVANVSKVIASVRESQNLFKTITEIISQQFNYYHVGIFLADERREYALLTAANSRGGEHMLARGHKLKIGQVGLVGYVADKGISRIALDTGKDATFFNNPDLPETRSELALPLKIGEVVIGVLDIQSIEASAFQEDDIEVLEALANQVAVAIENATLFEKTNLALRQAEDTYRQYILKEWGDLIKQLDNTGYQFSSNKAKGITKTVESAEMKSAVDEGQKVQTSKTMAVPVSLRGQIIGVLQVTSSKEKIWSSQETALLEAVAERSALALENARLIEQTRQRAQRDHIIAELSNKIGGSLEVESIIRSATQELSKALGDTSIMVRLENTPETKKDGAK